MKQNNCELLRFRKFFKLLSILTLIMCMVLPGLGQKAEKININNNMPNRISMNVTIAKQTQGATFGEKVNAGLQAAGSAVAQGASPLGAALPGGSIISAALSKVDSETMEWQVKNQGNGFTLPENIEPGEYNLSIVVASGTGTNDLLRTRIRLGVLLGEQGNMAVVSSVSGLSGGAGGGAAAASYAATGKVGLKPAKETGNTGSPGQPEKSAEMQVAENYYSIYINGVEYALVKAKSSRTNAKISHDPAKSIINNMKK